VKFAFEEVEEVEQKDRVEMKSITIQLPEEVERNQPH
jgi:hypothetical protein